MSLSNSIAILCALLTSQSSGFDEPVIPAVSAQEVSPQILVLDTGKVVRGRIVSRSDGYEVTMGGGRLFIPSAQVRFSAADLADAYRKLRSTYAQLTPSIHLQIAQWCLENGLPLEARRELLDALRLDPARDDARNLLARIIRENPGLSGASESAQSDPAPAVGRVTATSKTLGEFTRPVAQNFVQRVQPLISSRCATSGCHSRAKNSFSFESLRHGSTPQIAERNLSAVLKHINVSSPDDSSLLTAGENAHGGMTVPVFQGRSGNVQLDVLRAWVHSAAVELTPIPTADSLPELAGGSHPKIAAAIAQAGYSSPDASSNTLSAAGNTSGLTMPDAPHGRELTKDETDRKTLDEIWRQNRRDAFDPDVFNQTYRMRTTDNPTSTETKLN